MQRGFRAENDENWLVMFVKEQRVEWLVDSTPRPTSSNLIMEYRSNYVEKTFLHEVSESDEEEYEIVAKKASLWLN